ncbi:hypothetical protein CCR75_005178 [Bremia lactucae]|uniref:TFIIS N-terminal domain-containing protein n=1 Tax=Bremia lactucae TaxID=4779 RepID=A0A976FNV0_BRELC|nr:hypothetical protein CCR75_008757 [Bremia lactucae]TDH70237.1 hypothetical protein CCR75_005178 [Bremia lactucae]
MKVAFEMDNFVLHGKAAVPNEAPVSKPKRKRQTTIHNGEKVVSVDHVQYLKEELDDVKSVDNMLSILDALERLFMSLEMLEKTRIGISLTRLLRRSDSKEVQYRATKLLVVWKATAKKAIRRRARRVDTYGRNYAE